MIWFFQENLGSPAGALLFGGALLGAAALLLLLLLGGHLVYWRRRLAVELAYSLVTSLRTVDGARIELRRLEPPPDLQPAAPALPPVLLVHGVGANHRNQDAHPDVSLARYLAGRGRDVWLVTLRSGLRWRGRGQARVSFAAMTRHDVPLAIRTVLERTGSPRLDYVGFSMGGMLLYAGLGRQVPASAIRRAVLVGAPGRIAAPVRVPRWLGRIPRRLVPTLRLRLLALGFAFASEWYPTLLHRLLINVRNLSPGMTRLALANVIADIPWPLHAEFLSWASEGGVVRVGGEPVLEGCARVAVPALFVAGSADRVAPLEAVREAFDTWAADFPDTPKRLVVLGRDLGASQDYGHGDLALGAQVARELFEPIARFLEPGDGPPELPGPRSGEDAVQELVH